MSMSLNNKRILIAGVHVTLAVIARGAVESNTLVMDLVAGGLLILPAIYLINRGRRGYKSLFSSK